MTHQASRFALRRASLALALLAGLSGCQTPVVMAPPQPAATPAADRNAEIARILDLKNRGVITDAQAVEIMAALVAPGAAAPAAKGTAPALASAPAASPVAKPSAAAPTAPVPAPASAPAPAPAKSAPEPVSAAAAEVSSARAVDPRYKPQVVLSGRLRSIGSDTMDLLVARWEEIFKGYHPSIRIIHEGRGTSTATPALIEGQADIGPMSRAMLEAEAAKFRERFGYDAIQVRTAIDALAVYVHPDNPIVKKGLTLAQLDAIFSSVRKRGAASRVTTWGQLGLGAEWANAPIRVYGRNRASGTYGYFRDVALQKGDFGDWVEEQPSSQIVVTKVEEDRFGIGFSGVGYKTDGVAMVPLAATEGRPPVAPSEEAALDGQYPLARPLFLAVNRNPARPPSDLQREFLSFVLGPIGQEAVKAEGYYPLPAKILAEELAKLR